MLLQQQRRRRRLRLLLLLLLLQLLLLPPQRQEQATTTSNTETIPSYHDLSNFLSGARSIFSYKRIFSSQVLAPLMPKFLCLRMMTTKHYSSKFRYIHSFVLWERILDTVLT